LARRWRPRRNRRPRGGGGVCGPGAVPFCEGRIRGFIQSPCTKDFLPLVMGMVGPVLPVQIHISGQHPKMPT
jgi:hypothetical protein